MKITGFIFFFFSHLYRAYCYYQSFLLPTDAQENCFKKKVGLKFTSRQFQYISVLSPSSGSVLYDQVPNSAAEIHQQVSDNICNHNIRLTTKIYFNRQF